MGRSPGGYWQGGRHIEVSYLAADKCSQETLGEGHDKGCPANEQSEPPKAPPPRWMTCLNRLDLYRLDVKQQEWHNIFCSVG